MSDILLYIQDRPMLRVVVMMIAGMVIGRLSGTPFGVRESFCVLIGLMALTVVLGKWDVPATIAMTAVNFAFGFFLITNSDHNGEVATLPVPGLSRVEETMGDVRECLADTYRQQGLTDDEYAVVAAMTLGDKSAVTPELRDTYSKSGAAHVFAVSGLHLGILWGLLALLLPVKAQPRNSAIVMTVLIWMYAFLVGLHASVVRATVMLTCYTLCKALARDTDSVSVLVFTAFLLLVYNPQWLFDVGFQMSFLATLSILLFVPKMMSILPRRTRKMPKTKVWAIKMLNLVGGIVSVSICAQLAVAPLIAYYFGRFSTYFLLTNFIVSPGAFIIIVLAIVVSLLSLLNPLNILTPLNHVASLCLVWVVKTVNALLKWIISLPYSTVEDIHLSVAQVAIIYVLIVCFISILHLLPLREVGRGHFSKCW